PAAAAEDAVRAQAAAQDRNNTRRGRADPAGRWRGRPQGTVGTPAAAHQARRRGEQGVAVGGRRARRDGRRVPDPRLRRPRGSRRGVSGVTRRRPLSRGARRGGGVSKDLRAGAPGRDSRAGLQVTSSPVCALRQDPWMDNGAYSATQKPATAARMYDYMLGGFHNFPADQAAVKELVARYPFIPALARSNRAFVGRAVRYLTDAGVRQFFDIGSGIPTVGNVHEIAQDARVV